MNKCAVKLTPNDNHHHQHHDVEENIILTPPQKNEEKKKKTPNKNDVKRKHETDIYICIKRAKFYFFTFGQLFSFKKNNNAEKESIKNRKTKQQQHTHRRALLNLRLVT